MINWNKKPLSVKCGRTDVTVNLPGKRIVMTPGMEIEISKHGDPKQLKASNLSYLHKRRLVMIK